MTMYISDSFRGGGTSTGGGGGGFASNNFVIIGCISVLKSTISNIISCKEYYEKHNERWWKYPSDFNLNYNHDDNIDLSVHNWCYEKCSTCGNIYDPIWCGRITQSQASGDWGILTGPHCNNRRTYWEGWQSDPGRWTFRRECEFITSYILSG